MIICTTWLLLLPTLPNHTLGQASVRWCVWLKSQFFKIMKMWLNAEYLSSVLIFFLRNMWFKCRSPSIQNRLQWMSYGQTNIFELSFLESVKYITISLFKWLFSSRQVELLWDPVMSDLYRPADLYHWLEQLASLGKFQAFCPTGYRVIISHPPNF